MKAEHKVILVSLGFGLLVWIIDAICDWLSFYNDTFWNLLLFRVPPHEVYIRLIIIGCFLVFGVVISRAMVTRNRAQQALADETERLNVTLRSIGEAVIATDLKGAVVLMNPVAEELTGWPLKEALGKPLSEVFHIINEKTRIPCENPVETVLKTGEITGLANHTALVARDGSERSIAESGSPIHDAHGRIVGVVLVFRDVTDQRIAERDIGESEERLRTVVEASKDAIIALNVEGKIVIFNQAAEHMFDLSADQMLGKPLDRIIPPHLQEQHHRTLTAFLRDGVSRCGHINRTIEQRATRADGTAFPVEISLSAGRSNGLRLVVAVIRDIHERKQAEQQLRERTHLNQVLLDALPCAAFLLRRDRTIVAANRTAMDAGATPNSRCYEVWAKRDGTCPWCVADDVLATGRAQQREVEAHGLAWDTHWISVDEDLYLHYAFDITERKQTEDTLRQAHGEMEQRVSERTAELTAANGQLQRQIAAQKRIEGELAEHRDRVVRAEKLATLGTVAATLTHQIHQPLSVIRMALQRSLRTLRTISCPEIVLEILADSLDEVAKAASIINQFLKFARPSPDKGTARVDIHRIAERIAAVFTEMATRSKVKLIVEDMTALPTIEGDIGDIEQVFFILTENAIQAADAEQWRELHISAVARNEQIELRFADSCGGIAPENLDMLFEPFFTTKAPGQGTGLGLCILKQIVTKYGGEVNVQNRFGKGSTFCVTLPG